MSKRKQAKFFAISVLLIISYSQFGCTPQQPLFLTEKGQYQKHYISKAVNIDYPDADTRSLPEVIRAIPPLTLANPDPESVWDLKLEEAIQIALKNSKVIRTLSGVSFSKSGASGTPGALLQSPNGVGTVYDPALIESDTNAGIEAALSAFDGQWTAAAAWNKGTTDAGLNSNSYAPSWNPIYGTYGSNVNGGSISSGIQRIGTTGTQYYVSQHNTYNGNAPAYWSTYLEGGLTQPLLRGNGMEFNRIAGPNAAPGNYGGVAIARINTDTALVDFEMNARNLVAGVETAYWNLYYAYHRLESVRSGRDSAYQTWIRTKVKTDLGAKGGSAQYLAQSEHNYFTFRQQTEVAQSNLFKTEAALRYLLGLTSSDGRLIRTVDEPITAPIKLDWQSIVCEGLFRSPELRRQKWTVKANELKLIASKNFLLPQVDLNAAYRFAGAGKSLADNHRQHSSAVGSMLYDDFEGWTVGLNASMPFGWRRELAGVRNAQLYLARSRAILQEQELELTHQLADSFRDIDLAYQQMQTTLAGRRSANDEVFAVEAAYEAGTITLDQLLDAQQRQAEAETDYYSAVIDYNLAIMNLHYRKGTLLEYNNVCLTEGAWSPKAYFDAKRRARERDAGHYFNYGFTRPGTLSRGTYPQFQNSSTMSFEGSDTPSDKEIPPADKERHERFIDAFTDPPPSTSFIDTPPTLLPVPKKNERYVK